MPLSHPIAKWAIVMAALLLTGIPTTAAEDPAPHLVLTVSARSQVITGCELNVDVLLKNTSAHELKIGRVMGPVEFYRIDVKGPNGAPAKETWLLRKVRNNQRHISSFWEMNLKKKGEYREKVDVTSYYQMCQPGRYSIRLSLLQAPSVQSNELTVTVIEGKEASAEPCQRQGAVSILLSAPYDDVKRGTAVQVDVEIRNLTCRELSFSASKLAGEKAGLVVLDSQGKKPLSERGRKILLGENSLSFYDQVPADNRLFTIGARDSLKMSFHPGKAEQVGHVDQLYDVSRPGVYTIQYNLTVGAETFSSNTITVKVGE